MLTFHLNSRVDKTFFEGDVNGIDPANFFPSSDYPNSLVLTKIIPPLPQFWALLPFFTTKNVTFIHNVEQPENPCFWAPSVLDCNPLWLYKVQSFLWPIFQLWKKLKLLWRDQVVVFSYPSPTKNFQSEPPRKPLKKRFICVKRNFQTFLKRPTV